MPVMRRLAFDTERYPLAEAAAAVLGAADLGRLADDELGRLRDAHEREALTNEDSLRLRAKLAALTPAHPLRALYQRLVNEVVAPPFGGRIQVTSKPTFRVHLAGTGSVSAWHRDADVTSRPDYITCWAPFVDTFGTNTLWVERDYGSGDHAPVSVHYGEILLFDGALLEHGSVPNTTEVSRVSMDFRFAVNGMEGAERLFPGRPVFVPRPLSGAGEAAAS